MSAGTDAKGTPKQLWRTVRGSQEDAKKQLTKLLRERDDGGLVATQNLTLGEYLVEQYLPYQTSRIRASTWKGYEGLILRHVIPVAGHVQVQLLRPLDIQRVLDSMLQAGKAPRTVVQTYRVLSSALKQAVRWQLIAVNPASAVTPPRVERAALQIPNAEGVLNLLSAATGTWIAVPLLVAVSTGLRRGELLGIRWRDVDLSGGFIRVTGAIQRQNGTLIRVEPKSSRGRRTVGLPDITVEALRAHKTEQSVRQKMIGQAWQGGDLVFDRGDGAAIDPDSLTHAFGRLAKELGVTVRLHDLRHAYATLLLLADVHPKIVSEALGHSSTAFTMDTYSHVVPSMQRRAAEAIDEALGRG